MLIRHARQSDVLPSEITPHSAFMNRRELLRAAAATGAIAGLGPFMLSDAAHAGQKLPNVVKTKWTEASLGKDDKLTPYKDVTTYNNFYEFGTGKGDPAKNAHTLKPKPWTVVVDGHVEKPGRYDFDDLIRGHDLEERVYRFRCVEAWSMVIPWVGIPLANMIKRLGPTSNAKYVAFETLVDFEQMPGQKFAVLKWPYREGLRMDEAMNPLTLMAVGVYGEEMPNQNGAPIRLVTPWKYGFKSIKSVIRFTFTDERPKTFWESLQAAEYGFWANVNPEVSHPRWSQASEWLLGGSQRDRIPTQLYNGYAEFVADLYPADAGDVYFR